jgi:hypothetical protein
METKQFTIRYTIQGESGVHEALVEATSWREAMQLFKTQFSEDNPGKIVNIIPLR